ncbi:MAG: hypothetical protein OXN84_20820 [Albidovulum sp.]|nr:hypothetical protein [Albidovulum sp.]
MIKGRPPAGWEARKGAPALLHEKPIRKFGAAAKWMPALELRSRTGEFVTCAPHALRIIGKMNVWI